MNRIYSSYADHRLLMTARVLEGVRCALIVMRLHPIFRHGMNFKCKEKYDTCQKYLSPDEHT